MMIEDKAWHRISADELRDLRRDRDWADHLCRIFLKAEQDGDVELNVRLCDPLVRYARIRGISIPWES